MHQELRSGYSILLNYLPGVVTSDAGAELVIQIRVRGADATRVNVTINGIPYNDAESSYFLGGADFASSVGQFSYNE